VTLTRTGLSTVRTFGPIGIKMIEIETKIEFIHILYVMETTYLNYDTFIESIGYHIISEYRP
jgi:hypothetical protein